MENNEEKRLIKYEVNQYIRGSWIKLITIVAEEPAPEDDIQEALDELRNTIMKGGFVFMSNASRCVIFNKDQGPISIDIIEIK